MLSEILKGKRVLVTGGANGCGEAAVRGCVAAGASVVSTDIDDDRGQIVAADTGAGERCTYL